MKDYKRLTKRTEKGFFLVEYKRAREVIERLGELEDKIEDGTLVEWKHKKECLEEINKLNTQLFEISQKIEQGLLVELPCKVGDTVYSIPFDGNKKIFEHKITDLILNFLSENEKCGYIVSSFSWFGKNVFLTKAEAEARLQELRGEK